MTIKLQLNHTYRTRDGNAEHKITRIEDGAAYTADGYSWWSNSGLRVIDSTTSKDLIEDVTGPVRQRTITRTEIAPGDYGHIRVDRLANDGALVVLGFKTTGGIFPDARSLFGADELDALAATLTQLAAALRAIATEKGTTE